MSYYFDRPNIDPLMNRMMIQSMVAETIRPSSFENLRARDVIKIERFERELLRRLDMVDVSCPKSKITPTATS